MLSQLIDFMIKGGRPMVRKNYFLFVTMFFCLFVRFGVPSQVYSQSSGQLLNQTVQPAELLKIISIVKFVEDKIEADSPGLTAELKLNTILQSMELFGFTINDRSNFSPQMSKSQIAVLLAGGQVPSQRKVITENALNMVTLNSGKVKNPVVLKELIIPTPSSHPAYIRNNSVGGKKGSLCPTVEKRLVVDCKRSSVSKSESHPENIPFSENIATLENSSLSDSGSELYIKLDNIVNKAVRKAIK